SAPVAPAVGRPVLRIAPWASARGTCCCRVRRGRVFRLFRRGADLVDRQVGAVVFLFLADPQADRCAQRAVDDGTAGRCDDDAAQRACELGAERDPAQAAQRTLAEDAGGEAAPGAAQAV